LSQKKTWDDEEHFSLPPEIKKGIIEELNFSKPSIIQAVAIPLIHHTVVDTPEEEKSEQKFQNLIAQSKNGSGKTGAFTIGSVLRVDPSIPKP
jgi:superfamily II DNA/RNA helicase